MDRLWMWFHNAKKPDQSKVNVRDEYDVDNWKMILIITLFPNKDHELEKSLISHLDKQGLSRSGKTKH
ncbi:hypothetical protein H5410_003157 [Solanum commersonii]|uniref:Uncharacterized protein n=1 Tax=Solanum commersonii TaxID=4109 RepID=A0A9J6B494_SOLCO|nr:hypothetical protein H5410_003157 [Solanum commersonii]